jgi:hypothetical protein
LDSTTKFAETRPLGWDVVLISANGHAVIIPTSAVETTRRFQSLN